MRSIKVKLLLLVIISMFGLFGFMAYVGLNSVSKSSEEDFSSTMQILLDDKSMELNCEFGRVERGVESLYRYIKKNADPEKLKSDYAYRAEFYKELAEKGEVAGEIAGNVVTVYFRPDPTVYGSTAGVFMTDNGRGKFVRVAPTNIIEYNSDQREYVSWYYEPVENKEAMWLKPYNNKNVNVYMMSYAIPVYINNELLGVVGMDIRMSKVVDVLDSFEYKGGSALLSYNDGDIIYHKDYPEGIAMKEFNDDLMDVAKYMLPEKNEDFEIRNCTYGVGGQRIASKTLDSGMVVGVMVPDKECIRNREATKFQMMVIFAVVFIVVLAIFLRLMITIVLPIRDLTDALSRIAKGELNTDIHYRSKDEIGMLAKSVSKMELEMKDYFSYIHSQAFMDAMTGVGNKAAYMDLVKLLDRKITEGMAEFIVVVFDVNGLKNVNDNLGHEYGDMLICDAADIMKRVFSTENVFRIGGDEFIVVIENEGEEDIKAYFAAFDEEVVMFNENNVRYNNKLAVSKGGACYDSKLDTTYKSVFKRADEIMYLDKKEFYKGRNDRRS